MARLFVTSCTCGLQLQRTDISSQKSRCAPHEAVPFLYPLVAALEYKEYKYQLLGTLGCGMGSAS